MCIVFNLLLIFLRRRIEKWQRTCIVILLAELRLGFLKLRIDYLLWKENQVNVFHYWNLEDTTLK